MSYKLSLSYAILDDSTSAVTVLFHLEFEGLTVCGDLQGGGGGVRASFEVLISGRTREISLFFKIAWCLQNVTLVPYGMN
jgi:hypothetical protein